MHFVECSLYIIERALCVVEQALSSFSFAMTSYISKISIASTFSKFETLEKLDKN